MLIAFQTASGGSYLVDEEKKMIKRLNGDEKTQRATKHWKQYEEIRVLPGWMGLIIVWGKGRDEYSDTCKQGLFSNDVIPDNERVRITTTSPITAMAFVDAPMEAFPDVPADNLGWRFTEEN